MAIDTAYISSVLDRFEGYEVRGYVPSVGGKAMDQSGVTVGRGVDLGQTSVARLLALGVDPALVDKLSPYIGLKKEDACRALALKPLILADTEASALSAAVISRHIEDAARAFDARVRGGSAFAARPRQVQAVTVSLAYQYGTRGFSRTLGYLADARYQDAITELEDPSKWSGKYTTRRRGEAGLLKEVIQ